MFKKLLSKIFILLPVDSVLGRRLTRGDCDLGDIRGLSNCKEEKVNASLNPISWFSKWVSKEVVGKKGTFYALLIFENHQNQSL